MASTEPEHKHEHREEEETPTNKDKDTGAQVALIVKLEEIAVTTDEEDETSILDLYVSLSLSLLWFSFLFHRDLIEFRDFLFCSKAKLYQFDKDGNQWKEKGTGSVKFLKHKEHQRQEREKTN